MFDLLKKFRDKTKRKLKISRCKINSILALLRITQDQRRNVYKLNTNKKKLSSLYYNILVFMTNKYELNIMCEICI